jgi:hypothetical protein
MVHLRVPLLRGTERNKYDEKVGKHANARANQSGTILWSDLPKPALKSPRRTREIRHDMWSSVMNPMAAWM